MRKFLFPLALGIAFSAPALANSGHVIQVHHGYDCVEFALWEDAIVQCGASNVFLSNGTVNSACLANVPWYGIETGQGVGQTELTLGQLPFLWPVPVPSTLHFTKRKLCSAPKTFKSGKVSLCLRWKTHFSPDQVRRLVSTPVPL